MITIIKLFSSPSPSLREKGLRDAGETYGQYIAKPSPPAPLSFYQGRGGEVIQGCVSIASGDRFRKACHRNGITVIVMVLVLGGLAIALLTLAGQTSIQLKSIQNVSLDNQQCSELIALGERVLAARLLANSEFSKETIRLDLPTSSVLENASKPQIGIIELTKIANTDTRHRWTIDASFGASDGRLKQASKTVYLNNPTK